MKSSTCRIQDENLTLFFPRELHTEVVETVRKLSDLLKLREFTATFELEASHEKLLEVVIEKKLVVRFISGRVYNANFVAFPKNYYVDDDYGWFDARVDPTCVNINYDFYKVTSDNLPCLKVLGLVTAIHELQHFLRMHLDEISPAQPIPSLRPPQIESGDSWEAKNLGGRLGILSHKETTNIVQSLYLTRILNAKEIESLMNNSIWTETLLSGVSEGRNVFPLEAVQVIYPIPDIYFKSKVSHKCEEDSKIDSNFTLKDVLYKHIRPSNDKRGRFMNESCVQ